MNQLALTLHRLVTEETGQSFYGLFVYNGSHAKPPANSDPMLKLMQLSDSWIAFSDDREVGFAWEGVTSALSGLEIAHKTQSTHCGSLLAAWQAGGRAKEAGIFTAAIRRSANRETADRLLDRAPES